MTQEHQLVARDFMGLGKMRDVQEGGDSGDCGKALKFHEVDFGHLRAAANSLNKGVCFNSLTFAGLKHPIQSSSTAFQYLSSGNLHEEKFIEQSAESVPERSYTKHHQVQGWWVGDNISKRSPTMVDGFGLKTQAVGGLGDLPKNAVSIPAPDLRTLRGFSEVQQRTPVAEPLEKKDSAPLTIFYAGNVNVFYDITAKKAQEIMFMASAGNLNAICSPGGPNASAMNFAITTPSMQIPVTVSKASPTAGLHNMTKINVSTEIPADHGSNSFNTENGQTALSQPGLGKTNMQLDSGHPIAPGPPPNREQPVVPAALPQARKASLARFFERRKERAQSKSPYSLKQVDSSLLEEKFSSSNEIPPHMLRHNTNEKKKIFLPSWMEKRHEYSLDMIMKEDTTVVSA